MKIIEEGIAWWYEKYDPGNVEYKVAQEKPNDEKERWWFVARQMEP